MPLDTVIHESLPNKGISPIRPPNLYPRSNLLSFLIPLRFYYPTLSRLLRMSSWVLKVKTSPGNAVYDAVVPEVCIPSSLRARKRFESTLKCWSSFSMPL